MESLMKAVEDLAAELDADCDKPRWGLHGHHVVDDDYFLALAHAAERLRAVLSAHAQPEQATAPAATLPPLPPADVSPYDFEGENRPVEEAGYEQAMCSWGQKCLERSAAICDAIAKLPQANWEAEACAYAIRHGLDAWAEKMRGDPDSPIADRWIDFVLAVAKETGVADDPPK